MFRNANQLEQKHNLKKIIFSVAKIYVADGAER